MSIGRKNPPELKFTHLSLDDPPHPQPKRSRFWPTSFIIHVLSPSTKPGSCTQFYFREADFN
ncbi:hypothetical protein Mapa_007119 [Marchantia paleacea]|nr:hypothetical protein Mapa_007119 [Marchantia paleacea]